MQETHEQIDQWTSRVIRVTYEFSGFPIDIANIIAGYLATEQGLCEWIDPAKLRKLEFHLNPVAVKLGMIDLTKLRPVSRECYNIAQNPAAADFIRARPGLFTGCDSIWANPAILEWIYGEFRPGEKDQYDWLARNPCQRAVNILTNSYPGCFDLEIFSQNPAAAEWFGGRGSKSVDDDEWWAKGFGAKDMDKSAICANPNAIDIIQSLDEISYHYLSAN